MSSKDRTDGGRGRVVPFVDRPLNYATATTRIKEFWRREKFTWSGHTEQRMIELGWDLTDIENIIRYGKVVAHSKPGAAWRYEFEGHTVEQIAARAICEMQGELLVLVSVIRKGRWRRRTI